MRAFVAELRWGARRLARSSGTSLAGIIILALSIASTVTLFAVARVVLFEPLPFHDPDRLVVLERRLGAETTPLHSPADLIDLREKCEAFSGLSGSARFRGLLTGTAEPTYVTGATVTPEYLETLGAGPILGEIFRARSDGRPSDPRAAVISWRLWQNALGADREAVGRSISLNGEAYRIVAVMPADLSFLGVDLWIPGEQGFPKPPIPVEAEYLVRRDLAYLTVLGRLRPEWSLEAARSSVAATAEAIAVSYPAGYPPVSFSVQPFKDRIVGGARNHLTILWICVGLVFLIGCLSVSGLLLARGIARSGDDSIKLALGANRSQAALAGLAESLILAAAGGLLGCLGSIGGTRVFLSLAPAFPRSDQIHIDPWILVAAILAAGSASLLASITPVMSTIKASSSSLVLSGGRGHTGRSRKVSWRVLLTLEVGCMVVLLAVALSLGRRLVKLDRLDLGFSPSGLFVTLLEIPRERYPDPHVLESYTRQVLDRLKAVPGVDSLGAALPLPLSGTRVGGSFSIVGRPVESGTPEPSASFSTVTHDYFKTMEISILQGRSFRPEDRMGAPPVAAVDKALADRYWGEESPIGAQLILGDDSQVRVVAVVESVRHSLTEPGVEPRLYRPYSQQPAHAVWVALRSRREVGDLDLAVREAIHGLDSGQPVSAVEPMERLLSNSLLPIRYLLLIVGGLAGFAVVITALGLHTLLSLTVREEEDDLALRLTLGAPRSTLLSLHVRSGLFIALLGTLLGAAAAFLARPLWSRMLPDGETMDLVLLLIVALLTVLCATVSSLLGARRVLQMSPAQSLRRL